MKEADRRPVLAYALAGMVAFGGLLLAGAITPYTEFHCPTNARGIACTFFTEPRTALRVAVAVIAGFRSRWWLPETA